MTDTTAPAPQTPPTGAAPVTIDLGDLADEWAGMSVTIRPHLSYAASQRINGAAAVATAAVATGRENRRDADGALEVVNSLTPVEFAAATVEECVLSWTLKGYDGLPLSADRAGVQSPQAPAELLDAVVDEIHYHYESRAPKRRRRR